MIVGAYRGLGKNGFLRIELLIFSGFTVPFAAAIAQQAKGFRTFGCVLQPVSEKERRMCLTVSIIVRGGIQPVSSLFRMINTGKSVLA